MSGAYKSELCHALDETRMKPTRTTPVVSRPHASEVQLENNSVFEDEDPCHEVCNDFHSCAVIVPCRWANGSTPGACSAEISCKTIPAHFRDAHGIKQLRGGHQLTCLWRACYKSVLRKNFVRHIREVHLGHPR